MKGVSRLREKNPGSVLVGAALAIAAIYAFGLYVYERLQTPAWIDLFRALGTEGVGAVFAAPLQFFSKLVGPAAALALVLGLSRILSNKTWRKQDKKVAVLLRKRSEINRSIARGILDELTKIESRQPAGAVRSILGLEKLKTKILDSLRGDSNKTDETLRFGSWTENLMLDFKIIDFPSEDELRRRSESEQAALENAAVALNNALLAIAGSREHHAVVVRPIILNERFRRAIERLLEANIFVIVLEIEPGAMALPSGLPLEPVFLTPDHDEAGRKLGEFVNTVLDRDPASAFLVFAGPANDPAARVRSSALLWEVLGTTQHPMVRVEVIDSWGRQDKPERVHNSLRTWLDECRAFCKDGRAFGEAIVYAGSDGIVSRLCEHNADIQRRLGITIKYVSIDGSRSVNGKELDLQAKPDCLATVDVSPSRQGAAVVGILLNERLGRNAARYTPLETSRIIFDRASQ